MILRFLGDLPEPKAPETPAEKGSFTKKVYDTLSRKFSRGKMDKDVQSGVEDQAPEDNEPSGTVRMLVLCFVYCSNSWFWLHLLFSRCAEKRSVRRACGNDLFPWHSRRRPSSHRRWWMPPRSLGVRWRHQLLFPDQPPTSRSSTS